MAKLLTSDGSGTGDSYDVSTLFCVDGVHVRVTETFERNSTYGTAELKSSALIEGSCTCWMDVELPEVARFAVDGYIAEQERSLWPEEEETGYEPS
ncbi:MAG TPA: hypothetical protein VJJ22_03175 [Candidatus Paceibacterota bacterium]